MGSGSRVVVRAPDAWLGPGRRVDDAVVVIDGGVVTFAGRASDAPPAEEPADDLVVDGFLMPGVADRHVHIGFAEPADIVRGGVTSVRDLGWPPDVVHAWARASEDPVFDGPRIRAVGPILTCPGGYPTKAGWAPIGTGLEVRDPDSAAGAVRSVLADGSARAVKVAMNADAGPVLGDPELEAIVAATHAAGALVTAHVQGAGQAERAVRAGVDEFAHCPWSERLPDDLVVHAARRMRVVSTLDIHSFGRDMPELTTALDNLRRFVAAGGRVAYGTDLGNGPIPAGIDAREAGLLRRAGLPPEGVLAAMTPRGLEAGAPADLVALAEDPLAEVAAFERPSLVIRGGRRIV